MTQNYTIISFDAGNPLRCTLQRFGVIDKHRHDIFEIDMLLSGTCQVTVGETTFSAHADDVFSIEAHVPHSLFGSNCTLISIQMDQGYFERTLPEPKHPEFECNSALYGDSAAYGQLRRLIARLVKNNAGRQLGYETRNWAIIFDLMDLMYQNFRVEDSEARNQRAHQYTVRINEITRIISEGYKENLTLSSLADQVHLSVPYLSKFFEKQFGITFLAYLTKVRLDHAVGQLIKSSDNIETISADSGFPNSHSFVQAFKKEYGVLPSVYRRQARTEVEDENELSFMPEQHDYMAGLAKYIDAPEVTIKPQAVSCRAVADAGAVKAGLRHTWKTMCAITSARAILTDDIQTMLRRVQKDIGYSYIRFNGILSDDMHVYYEDQSGNPVYSFTYVDKVFDFLLSIGLRPLVQLSFMPQILAKKQHYVFGYLISEPVSNEKWSALVKALVTHLQERYGREEVRSWLFAVWHLAGTNDNLFGFSGEESFRKFYKATYTAVKSCDREISFGTPSTYYMVLDGYTNWYIGFTDWCKENGCMPDFLNFNYYDLERNEKESGQEAFGFASAMTLGENGDGFNQFIAHLRREIKKLFPDGIKVYLTEWNNTPSQQDLLNDTCFKSCYIAKGILENYDKLDSFAYWSLTDWMGESPQPEEMFFGGLGLFTSGGIPKASYYALTLINRLGDELLGRGNGWFITKRGGGFAVMLYNYRHFSHLYALGERFDMTFTERYTPFAPEQLLDVHLTIRNVPSGSYNIKETIVSRKSGSAFDQWAAMGGIELKGADETDNLIWRSVPKINKYIAADENGELNIDCLLDMLEVRLIEIDPA